MTTRRTHALYLFVALCLLPTVCFAHTGEVYFAVEGTATVDGNLADWSEASWATPAHYTETLGQPDNADDFSVGFAVRWSGDLVYVAARVRDDTHHCTRQGTNTHMDDSVSFSFIPSHSRDVHAGSTWWRYALSSQTGKIEIGPSGRFSRVPPGLEFVEQAVVRDGGETRYEGAVRVPFTLGAGKVCGFGFSAVDSDGFKEGSYSFAPGTLTRPSLGGADIVLVTEPAAPGSVTGAVSGPEPHAGQRTYVHAFTDGVLQGSAFCGEDGAFRLTLQPGRYSLAAYQGGRKSPSVDVSVAASLTSDAGELVLGVDLGAITGRVLQVDGETRAPSAMVSALLDGETVAVAIGDTLGQYRIDGLDAGTYELVCSLAEGDTLKGITVADGETVAAPDPFTSGLSFSRTPASDEIFAVLLEWFGYDRVLPLEAEVEEEREIASYVRQTISYNSVHDERVTGYLALPPAAKREAPLPCLLALHAHINQGKDRPFLEFLRRRLTDRGFAVFSIDTKYYNSRHANGKTAYDMRGQNYRRRDAEIQTLVDYRRAIDYLSTRSEIDSTRIGIYGGSMGAGQCLKLGPVEPRVKAVVLRGPGLSADQWNPGVDDRIHFLPRMGKRPVMVLNGFYDHPWAVHGTLCILRHLQGPVQMQWYDTSHTVPPELYVDDMLSWLDDNL